MTPSHFCDYLFFEEDLALYLIKLEFPSPKDKLYQVWLNLACWLWRNFFFLTFIAFSLFRSNFPLEKGYPLSLEKLIPPSPKDDLCQVWLKFAQWFWRFLNDPHPIFTLLCLWLSISSLKRIWPSILTNLNSLHPRIMFTKFDWIWPASSEDF
jgi:hypothetical protein